MHDNVICEACNVEESHIALQFIIRKKQNGHIYTRYIGLVWT